MSELCVDEVNSLLRSTHYWGMVDSGYGYMYLAGNDDGIAVRYCRGVGYEPQSLALWARLAKGAELVVDVGAHTGIYSIAAYHAGAKYVVSIEPMWLNAARLVINLRANRFPVGGVKMMAASDREGIGNLAVSHKSAMLSYCSAGGRLVSSSGGLPILVNRVDNIIPPNQHEKVSLVKIDVEGHTAKVLQGMPSILKHKPDLIFEASEANLGTALSGLGYYFYEIDERTGVTPVSSIVVHRLPDGSLDMDKRNRYATVRP